MSPNLLAELYPFRAQVAYTIQHGTPCTPVQDAQTLAAYLALQEEIRTLEATWPGRWTPPQEDTVDDV